ncbi:MAG: DinB family protein [Prosthecobacter sp.]|nr:DinB family protein [Prosthecobacter sp.]
MDPIQAPKLAPPGAGLPALELFFARRLFALKRILGNRQNFIHEFTTQKEAILTLARSCAPDQRRKRVLIPRLPGLEDSSRYWSIWMTLEHLRITNNVFGQVITALLNGQAPEKKASTAAVKPNEILTEEVEDAFDASCDAFLATIHAAGDLNRTAKYAHPWFGPLDGYGWLAMAAMHPNIHRKQIMRILERL